MVEEVEAGAPSVSRVELTAIFVSGSPPAGIPRLLWSRLGFYQGRAFALPTALRAHEKAGERSVCVSWEATSLAVAVRVSATTAMSGSPEGQDRGGLSLRSGALSNGFVSEASRARGMCATATCRGGRERGTPTESL